MTLNFDPVTLTFDIECLQPIACDVMKLCTKFERNRAIRSIVIAILVFDLMTLNILRYVLRSVVWPSTTYPCLNYSVFDADTLCHAVTLTFNLLILNFYSTSGSCVKALYKIWAKSNSPPLSYWRFSPFSLCNFRGIWGTTDKRFSGVCGPNFTKLGVDIGRPFLHKNFFSVQISCCIFKCEQLKVEWCWKRRQISHFLTTFEN